MKAGGWKYVDMQPCALPEKVATGFPEAMQGIVGVSYVPVLYCGTQTVSGVNHMIICKGILATQDHEEIIAKMILHEEIIDEITSKFTVHSIDTISK